MEPTRPAVEDAEPLVAPTVSIALCTHNGARFIEEQLESVLTQTVPPTQIVVSDDASDDDTVGLVRRTFASLAPRHPDPSIELVVLENRVALGVTANFEQAILATHGDLVALCDQDDRWHPDRLESAVREFARRPGLLLLHADARLVDSAGEPLGYSLMDALAVTRRERDLVHSGAAVEAFLRRNVATGATTVIRRSMLDAAIPFPREWVHDEWLAIVAAAVGEVDFVERSLLDYRQHGANEIGARKLSIRIGIARIMEPRDARNSRLAGNAEILVERLTALGPVVPATTLEKAKGKLAHERVRNSLPVARLGRLLPITREVARGGYASYGRGAIDIVRDVLQPAGERRPR